MASIRNNLFLSSLVLGFLFSLVTNWYTEISIFLLVVTIFSILDKLGKGLVLRELVVLHTIFICLIMPSVGYNVYNYDNYLARIFYRFMQVPEDTYFGFTLPAICAFSIAMCFPVIKNKQVLDEGNSFKKLLDNVMKELRVRVSRGITIVVSWYYILVYHSIRSERAKIFCYPFILFLLCRHFVFVL